MQYAMPFLNFLLSWCCLTHFCKWKKNILVTEQNPDSKSCYLVHNKHQPTAPIWPLVDDSCRLPRIPLLVESLWRVFFLGACPGNDKRYCNHLANNSVTLVWGDYIFNNSITLVWGDYTISPLHPPLEKLLPLMSKPLELILRYLGQRIHRSGKMYWMTFPWPWLKVTAGA